MILTWFPSMSDDAQRKHSHEVKRDRVPQISGSYLWQSANSKLIQTAVATLRVGEFSDRGSLFERRLGFVRLHAFAKGGHLIGVARPTCVRVAAAFDNAVRVSHRSGDLAARLFNLRDVIV